MEKYLIEVPHDGDKASCTRTVKEFLASGSHFVTNAEWGAKMEITKHGSYKINAKITRINKFTRADLDEVLEKNHT